MAASYTYLKQRKLGWYVQVAVPRQLQATLGKTLTRSLRTRDEVEAQRRKHAVVAEFQSLIRQAAAIAPPPPAELTPEGLIKAALQERSAVAVGEQHAELAEAAVDSAVDDYLEQQAAIHGRDAEGNPQLTAQAEAVIKRAYGVLRGRPDLSLSHNVAAYLLEQQRSLTAQTIGDKRRRLEAFLEWFGSERECREVTRSVAGTYVTEVVQKRMQKGAAGEEVPLSPTTLGKEVSDLRSFFMWLERRGRIAEGSNPFYRMASTVKGSSRAKPAARRPWKPSELSKVLHGIEPNDPLWSLTVIAAYTGMRREEVAELELTSVHGSVLRIEKGKTVAARRDVPIHSVIAPLVKQLAKNSGDGYLIPGLLRGGPDKKRSWYAGKRFGRLIRDLGIADSQLDFHALRGTVITQLEEAAIPIPTIQCIVGHERQGVTLGYSAGPSEKVLRAALSNVTFGKLDEFVADTGASVVVKASAKPRKKASS